MDSTGYTCEYMCIYIYANKNNQKRYHEFERKHRGVYGRNRGRKGKIEMM